MVVIVSKAVKKAISTILSLSLLITIYCLSTINVSAATSTGVGLAEHAMTAYNEHWRYVYGGTSYGAVDCSGLIVTYNKVGGIRNSLLTMAPEVGYVSEGIPNIHGLGLYQPGHVGVYVGSGMAVDARDEYSGIVYSNVYKKNWTKWFKVYGVEYPESGWVKFQGNYFYYENGEYIVNTTRTINDEEYTFNSLGYSNKIPTDTTVSYITSSSSSSTVNDTSSKATNSISSKVENVSSQIINNTVSSTNNNSSNTTSKKENNTLQYGSSGNDVKYLQERLKLLGYFEDNITGYYGSYTQSCVKDFQNYSNLKVTGIVDDITKSALYSNNAKEKFVTYKLGDYDDTITNIQNKLIALQYLDGESNGSYDENTKVAISDFQKENNLTVTGEADKITQQLLFSDNVKINSKAGTLKSGMKGDKITVMQSRLIELRYLTGTPTNIYDDNTINAVKIFLKTNNFDESNEITKEQLEVLYSSNAIKSPEYDNLQMGYAGDDIEVLQNNLTILGYYKADINGIFDDNTYDAVIKSQNKFNLEETGIADIEYIKILNNAIDTFELNVANEILTQKANLASEKMASYTANNNITTINENGTKTFTDKDKIILWSIVGGMIFISFILLVIGMAKNKYLMQMIEVSEKSIVVGKFNKKRKNLNKKDF